MHAERVEPLRDAKLVEHGEGNAEPLAAVAQGGVVDSTRSVTDPLLNVTTSTSR
jgi:hypothetical protein